MPVRNAEPWLSACIESIQDQSHQNWELIATLDRCADRSEEVLREFAKQDGRIQVLLNQGFGISSALQTSWKKARGNWITRMDADDLMPENKLSGMLDAAKQHPDSVITGKVQYFPKEAISDGYLEYEAWLNERVQKQDFEQWIYRECTVAGANWLTHRDNLPEHFDHLSYPEDYDLVFWWYEQNHPIIGINEVTHLWRDHGLRTSKTSDHYAQEAFFWLKIHRFLQLDYLSTHELILVGRNKKMRLTKAILDSRGIKYEILDQSNLEKINSGVDQQILVCVFPELRLRKPIHAFHDARGKTMGKDWWWV